MKLVDFGLMALLWSYGVIYVRLLTLTAVFRCLESVEEQPAYNGLLFNLVVPSVPQGRQWVTNKFYQSLFQLASYYLHCVASVLPLLCSMNITDVTAWGARPKQQKLAQPTYLNLISYAIVSANENFDAAL